MRAAYDPSIETMMVRITTRISVASKRTWALISGPKYLFGGNSHQRASASRQAKMTRIPMVSCSTASGGNSGPSSSSVTPGTTPWTMASRMALRRMTNPQKMKRCIRPAKGSRNSLDCPRATTRTFFILVPTASKRFSPLPNDRSFTRRIEEKAKNPRARRSSATKAAELAMVNSRVQGLRSLTDMPARYLAGGYPCG